MCDLKKTMQGKVTVIFFINGHIFVILLYLCYLIRELNILFYTAVKSERLISIETKEHLI